MASWNLRCLSLKGDFLGCFALVSSNGTLDRGPPRLGERHIALWWCRPAKWIQSGG